MSDSMITRCPKCSTTFRVTQEVLDMAKGKVRCGQCFHIFAAQAVAPNPTPAAPKPKKADIETKEPVQPSYSYDDPEQKTKSHPPTQENSPPVKEDGTVNPKWLDTLFHEEDLAPYTPPSEKEHSTHPTPAPTPKPIGSDDLSFDDLAPWEVELAELENEFSQKGQPSEPVFGDSLKTRAQQKTPSKPSSTSHINATSEPLKATANATPKPVNSEFDTPVEPDYMQALHSLAQDISKQDTLTDTEYSSQENMKQLAAEYSLASLTTSDEPKKRKRPSKFSWLWALGSVLAILLLAIQIAVGFFDQGSRSPEFRGFYKAACSYIGCTLPAFEEISAIEIEHVRIQSHPTLPNTLQVNAIMTNTSAYAQPMPKLALEFYDLNRRPVAARLFSAQSYLHKDFLDITYMPPNTPIHVVIPIRDPGARAVTHQIKVFSSQTQSY